MRRPANGDHGRAQLRTFTELERILLEHFHLARAKLADGTGASSHLDGTRPELMHSSDGHESALRSPLVEPYRRGRLLETEERFLRRIKVKQVVASAALQPVAIVGMVVAWLPSDELLLCDGFVGVLLVTLVFDGVEGLCQREFQLLILFFIRCLLQSSHALRRVLAFDEGRVGQVDVTVAVLISRVLSASQGGETSCTAQIGLRRDAGHDLTTLLLSQLAVEIVVPAIGRAWSLDCVLGLLKNDDRVLLPSHEGWLVGQISVDGV